MPYRKNVHEKQPWLRDFLYQWQSEKWSRTKAMPHIKTYAQIEDQKANFVLLTSANLSKAAWGKLNKNRDKLNIMSFEAGILLVPKFVIEGSEYFDLEQEKVILPYDATLQKYDNDDVPFFYDLLLNL